MAIEFVSPKDEPDLRRSECDRHPWQNSDGRELIACAHLGEASVTCWFDPNPDGPPRPSLCWVEFRAGPLPGWVWIHPNQAKVEAVFIDWADDLRSGATEPTRMVRETLEQHGFDEQVSTHDWA